MFAAEFLEPAEDVGGPAQPLLEARRLTKHFIRGSRLFAGKRAVVRAVDDVSFSIVKGEVLSVVGESGCGKSTLARLLIGLIEPNRGEIIFDGELVREALTLRDLRRRVQMVFQDSYASLNPRITIEETIAFGPKVNGAGNATACKIARDLLAKVGLEPNDFAGRYPHELSGGQRQRVNIARALALAPRLVILDEAVSALDKSVEAQVLNLLADLREQLGLTYLFISHDLDVVSFFSDRVMVMYLGEIVEIGTAYALFQETRHPYTQALLAAMPSSDPERRTAKPPITGDPPSPIAPPSGCRFHPRCAYAEAVCSVKAPQLGPIAAGHAVACHMAQAGSGHSRAGQPLQRQSLNA
ncbi:MAG TPA: ABC transporter ATP-binding protein [Hyphomicrobiales bacterium]|nr:ABC transporter ATP-binding protein [Hyphomicrobiales bacterium]